MSESLACDLACNCTSCQNDLCRAGSLVLNINEEGKNKLGIKTASLRDFISLVLGVNNMLEIQNLCAGNHSGFKDGISESIVSEQYA